MPELVEGGEVGGGGRRVNLTKNGGVTRKRQSQGGTARRACTGGRGEEVTNMM